MELWIVQGLGAVLAALSAFGFLNAFFLRFHGPGGDLGVIAGLLAVGAFAWARFIRKNP